MPQQNPHERGDDHRYECAEKDDRIGREAGGIGRHEQGVGAETNKGLMTEGQEARIAAEQVPALGHRKDDQHLDGEAAIDRQQGEHYRCGKDDAVRDNLDEAAWSSGSRLGSHTRALPMKSVGAAWRRSRTEKKARWPKSGPELGLIFRPTT